METEKFITVKTTKRSIDTIKIDISDESCLPFGFKHQDIVICPNGLEAIIGGVAKGNNEEKVLWFTFNHPRTKDLYCYWEGHTNLQEAGFKKKEIKVLS